MLITISLGGFVAEQMRYNLESNQYLLKSYNIIIDR